MNCGAYVLTGDLTFKRQMQTALPKLFDRELITYAAGLPEVRTKLNKALPNILICDTDDKNVAENLMAQMTATYKLAVIYTGSGRYAPSAPNANYAPYISKIQLNASEATFLNSIKLHINPFLLSNAPRGMKDAHSAAAAVKKIIAIASSTGGTDALEKILLKLKADAPPVVVVQHMPSGFTKLFADRLNAVCAVGVREAKNQEYLRTGEALIAPAGLHMKIRLSGGGVVAECFDGPRMHGVIPAADILFDSVAEVMKQNAVGVILTGMGSDGARGLMKMHLSGARTVGQDKATCVVYGMPKVAYDLGAVDFQLPLDQIADKMISLAK